jgi:hypothetical protein
MERERSEHLRKQVTGGCMIAAPLVLVVAELMHPDDKTEAADQVAVIAGGLDRWYAAHALEIAGFALLVGAVLGLAHLLHERRPGAAVVGGGLTLVGIVAVTAGIGAEGIGGYYLVKNTSRAEAVRALDGMWDGMGLMAFWLVSLFIGIGFIVMAVNLWRSRVMAPWQSAALVLGSLCVLVAGPTATQALFVAGMVLFFVGLAPMGYLVMTESDAEWEHTPDFRGFRRTAAMGA